jgi:hypothetical protein
VDARGAAHTPWNHHLGWTSTGHRPS